MMATSTTKRTLSPTNTCRRVLRDGFMKPIDQLRGAGPRAWEWKQNAIPAFPGASGSAFPVELDYRGPYFTGPRVPLVNVLKLAAAALTASWLNWARNEQRTTVWTRDAADVHAPRLPGKGCVDPVDETDEKRIPVEIAFVARSPLAPCRAAKVRRNGKIHQAGGAVKALCVPGEKRLPRGLVNLRWRWTEPEAFVIVRKLVSARPASVSVAEHG